MPWPWRELNELGGELFELLEEGVQQVMREAGEDPENKMLYLIRCEQVADSIRAKAREANPRRLPTRSW